MKKLFLLCAFAALGLAEQSACEEYIAQSKIYLNELYMMKEKQLQNDEQAFRIFKLKFDSLKKSQEGQEAIIRQNNDEKFCKKELGKMKGILEEMRAEAAMK